MTAVVVGALWPVGGGKGSEGGEWGGSVEDGGGSGASGLHVRIVSKIQIERKKKTY